MREECAELHWPALVSLGSVRGGGEGGGMNDGGQERMLTRAKSGASWFDHTLAHTLALIHSQTHFKSTHTYV